jgi:raffinose/stachyose/melibiose transport system substrate-binding protein
MTKHPTKASAYSRRDLLRYAGVGGLAVGTGSWLANMPALAASYGDVSGFMLSSQKDPLSQAVAAFEAANPGSKVAIEYSASDQLPPATRVQLGAGTASDLITVWPGGGNALSVRQLAPEKFLHDLSDRPWAKDIPAVFHPVMLVDGKHYFLSMQISMIGGIVNMQTWNKLNGLTQPTTWSEFVAFCQKVKDQGVVPIAVGNGDAWVTQLITYALVASIVFGRNPAFAEEHAEGKQTFLESGWKEAMEKYLELQERGFFNENVNGTSNQEQIQMVANGDALMMIMVSNQVPGLLKAAGHSELWQMPIPGTDNAADLQVPASASSGMGVNAAAKNIDGAVAFLDFLATPESVAAWGELSGLATMLPGSATKYDHIYKEMMPLFRSGRTAIYMDNKWPNSRVQQTHMAGIQEILNKTATIDDVLKRMDEAYSEG